MKTVYSFIYGLLLASLVGACALSSTSSPETERIIGLIPTDHGSVSIFTVIEAPPTVQVNQLFTATVNTFGSGSCTTIDGADVQIAGLVASITPYDRVPVGDVVCTADLAFHPRPVSLTFTTVGTATLRVIGQNFDGGETVNEEQILVTP